MFKKLLLVAIFFIPSISFASNDYIEIFDKFYLNTSLTKFDKKNVTVNFWTKILNGSDFYPEFENKNTYYILQNWEISCPNMTYSIPVTHLYDKKENLVNSYYDTVLNEKVVPQTFTEVFYSYYCQP